MLYKFTLKSFSYLSNTYISTVEINSTLLYKFVRNPFEIYKFYPQCFPLSDPGISVY